MEVERAGLVQTLQVAGTAAGSLLCGFVTQYGRWTGIMLSNVLVIVGTALSLLSPLWCYILGRIISGIAAGAFLVFCPIYITEVSPNSVRGQLGFLN